MKKDKIYLHHIYDSIKNIENFLGNLKKEEFEKNTLVQSAVMRQLEIIGEASKKISPDLKKRSDQIPWKDIAGLRDKLIHDYFGVDIPLVWTICLHDIQKLKKDISGIMKINI